MSIHNRKCDLCGQHVPEGDGTYHAPFRMLLCRPCGDIVARHEKDHSRSRRGRLRSKSEALRAIRGREQA